MTAATTHAMQLAPELRQLWLDALRDPANAGRECYLELSNSRGQFCALGLLLHASGQRCQRGAAYNWLREQGVDLRAVWRVFDGRRLTFSQFADWLEEHSEDRGQSAIEVEQG